MIYKLKEDDDKNVEHIFFNKKEGVVHNTFRSSDIHCAYRGGRVEAFKTGIVEGVNYIDNNGLYPFMLSNIKCPDLRSERKLWRPLSRYSKEDILKEIGISRCLLKNESNDLGLLSIRTSSQNYFPKSGKYLIGTWTNREISKALDEGYVLIDIEWTVSWKEAHNPFKRIIDELYSARLSSSSKIENWFYKMMMNASIGKMAQHRTGQEILIDDIDDARDYLKKNYEILKGIKDKYMYVKKVEGKKKKYYMPIISTIVNANARIKMYDELKKIKESDLIYSDTDSIIYTGEYDDKFIFSNKLGDFKKVYSKEDMCIYGRKTYSIGKDIKISGFNQRDMDIEDFKKGIVKAKRMITIKTTDKIKEVGRFIEESRDLNKQLINHKDSVDLINEQVLMIDYDIDDVSYFMGKLELEKKSLFDL